MGIKFNKLFLFPFCHFINWHHSVSVWVCVSNFFIFIQIIMICVFIGWIYVSYFLWIDLFCYARIISAEPYVPPCWLCYNLTQKHSHIRFHNIYLALYSRARSIEVTEVTSPRTDSSWSQHRLCYNKDSFYDRNMRKWENVCCIVTSCNIR